MRAFLLAFLLASFLASLLVPLGHALVPRFLPLSSSVFNLGDETGTEPGCFTDTEAMFANSRQSCCDNAVGPYKKFIVGLDEQAVKPLPAIFLAPALAGPSILGSAKERAGGGLTRRVRACRRSISCE